MKKVTIVIPARHEIYLQETVKDILNKARGDIEVIVVLDNYWTDPALEDDKRVSIVHWGGRRGMRAAINAGAELGKGDYLLKVDAHILFDEGFDVKLAENCDADWLVVPRRYSLDCDEWQRKTDKGPIDYEFLHYPEKDEHGYIGIHAREWRDRRRARFDVPEYQIDENMSFQGSCWFMPMPYFKRLIYPMDEQGYGMFIGEPQEIGLKVWLSGGKNMVNKNTWYAHMWKGRPYREKFLARYGFPYTRVGNSELKKGNAYSFDFWFNNRPFPQRIHNLEWLIDRFAPVPSWGERNTWTTYTEGLA
jgi:glycosyltransferase involved in cell wall biosynthesis